MREKTAVFVFHSVFGPMMEQFIQEKQACGYRYNSGHVCHLRYLDRFLVQEEWSSKELPKELMERWLGKRPNEKHRNYTQRRTILRQFGLFLFRMDIPTYIPPAFKGPIIRKDFTARIFTKDEIRRIFIALDALPQRRVSPKYHLVMPEIFRLLYCCGLRLGEALQLQVKDVDFPENMLFIRNGKFGKDRLVPMAPAMTERLRRYVVKAKIKHPDDFLFPAPDGGRYHNGTVYTTFRKILREAGISHGGRGCGPRIHDLRHTYAAHRLVRWRQEGADLRIKLPILSTYLGHRNLDGTQRYLQLTADMFPELTEKLEKKFGHVIPGGVDDETN